MKVDKIFAEEILIEESKNSSQTSVSPKWVEDCEKLARLCEKNSKTFIAMLGTALLAKATNIKIDPFSLQVGDDSDGAYSARSLCQHVLAANAPMLGLNIGTTGREPLNNQPFFAKKRITKQLPVHQKSRKAFGLLFELLNNISSFKNEKEARMALRSYLKTRILDSKEIKPVVLNPFRKISDLIESIAKYVADDSEFGKRAQASVAGFLAGTFPEKEVKTTKVHDPDRNFPGDVILMDDDIVEMALEVRDKPVNEADVGHFILKVAKENVAMAGIVAIANNQPELDAQKFKKILDDSGVLFLFFEGWDSLIKSSSFWSGPFNAKKLSEIYSEIFDCSKSLEVSTAGLEFWSDISNR